MSARVSQNDKRKKYRLAVVVSKKVDKLAVNRNRIRRRVYEVVRQLKLKGTPDVVITIFSATVAEIPATELESQVKELLRGIIEPMENQKEINV